MSDWSIVPWMLVWSVLFLTAKQVIEWNAERHQHRADDALRKLRKRRARERRIHAKEHQLGLRPSEACFPGCRIAPEKVTQP